MRLLIRCQLTTIVLFLILLLKVASLPINREIEMLQKLHWNINNEWVIHWSKQNHYWINNSFLFQLQNGHGLLHDWKTYMFVLVFTKVYRYRLLSIEHDRHIYKKQLYQNQLLEMVVKECITIFNRFVLASMI